MMEFVETVRKWLELAWPYVGGALAILLSVGTSLHAILYKRDVRASIGWTAIIWLVPFVGSALYLLLGINRIRRRAIALRGDGAKLATLASSSEGGPTTTEPRAHILHDGMRSLARLVDCVSRHPLTAGNTVTPLVEGHDAYPEMLRAIDEASRTVVLSTYIFDRDPWGMRFVEALGRAKDRGVDVRVLIDDAGARYSWPPITRDLRERGVATHRFLPAFNFLRVPYVNLRNHRKILVADGRVGFTGGMNIRQGHVLADAPRSPIRDVHFRIEGPVVRQLAMTFAEDWAFASGEILPSDRWFPDVTPVGDVLARGIADGPDADLDRIRWTWLGALASARRSIRIVTPYFLPEQPVVTALNVAAMRGLEVDIVLPSRVNLRVVEWAMTAGYWQFLEHGVRVWRTPPPFDHAKLFVVDGQWTFLGSANWDPRSLRLNFEFGLECYDESLAQRITDLVDERIARARRLSTDELNARSFPAKVRDSVARLLSPYL